MSQFCGSLAEFSRRSDVTSAAIAVVAKAATPIDANAVTKVFWDIRFLPGCMERNSSNSYFKPRCPLWKGGRGLFCSFDTLPHMNALARGKAKVQVYQAVRAYLSIVYGRRHA